MTVNPRCTGGECPNAQDCYRYDPSPDQMTKSYLVHPPFNFNTNSCEYQFPQPFKSEVQLPAASQESSELAESMAKARGAIGTDSGS